MTGQEKKYWRAPQPGLNFQELFQFAWENGVGNRIDKSEDPVPWTAFQMEDAFTDYSYTVSARAIEAWKSGSSKPNSRNLHSLSKVFSAAYPERRRLWSDALFAAAKQSEKTVQTVKKQSIAQLADLLPDTHDQGPAQSQPSKKRKWGWASGLIAGLIIGSVVGAGFMRMSTPKASVQTQPLNDKPVATDIRFCTKDQFSDYAKQCLIAMNNFSAGTKDIYVSFTLVSVPDGAPFERRWYRNGEIFHSKDGFNDEAWKGYTYLINPDGHDAGYYAMRILANNAVSTSTFVVAK